jgi:multiple sugar transport system substrate-binding protein
MEAALNNRPRRLMPSFCPWIPPPIACGKEIGCIPSPPSSTIPTLTARDYNLYDFPEGFRLAAMYPPGEADPELFGIPATVEVYLLFYNQRMVDRFLGGRVPQTMAELVQAATRSTPAVRPSAWCCGAFPPTRLLIR